MKLRIMPFDSYNKISGRLVRHSWWIIYQLAEVAVPRDLFAAILEPATKLRLVAG